MRISCLVIVSNARRGNVIAYYQCTSRTELGPGAARESGHNSMCRKGLKNLAPRTGRGSSWVDEKLVLTGRTLLPGFVDEMGGWGRSRLQPASPQGFGLGAVPSRHRPQPPAQQNGPGAIRRFHCVNTKFSSVHPRPYSAVNCFDTAETTCSPYPARCSCRMSSRMRLPMCQ